MRMIGMMAPGRVKARISSLPRVGGWLICLVIACCLCAHAKPVVLGYERTQQEPSVDLTRAGLLLLGELGCANCHETDRDARSLFDTRTAPRLRGVGSRLNGGYLKRFLADPQGAEPGTTMPRQLRDHAEPEREHAISALTRFLLSSTDDVSENKPSRRRRSSRAVAISPCGLCGLPRNRMYPSGRRVGVRI